MRLVSPGLVITVLSFAQKAFAEDATATPDKSGYTISNPTPVNLRRPYNTDRPSKTDSPYAVFRHDYRAMIGLLPIAAAMIFYLVRPNCNRE